MDILGIDISKSKFDVALLIEEEYRLATFENDPVGFVTLRKWLKKQKVDDLHACLEATGRYGDELALFLHETGYQVSVVNPARIQAYAASQLKRNKTDKEDAKIIAHFCATQAPERWTPPSQAQQELHPTVRGLPPGDAGKRRLPTAVAVRGVFSITRAWDGGGRKDTGEHYASFWLVEMMGASNLSAKWQQY